jgi:hypothetical protein
LTNRDIIFCYNSTIVLADGDYDQPTRIETNNQTNWRGRMDPLRQRALASPQLRPSPPSAWVAIDAYEPFVVWNFATIEGSSSSTIV